MLKMKKLNCLSFKISTQNLVLSVSVVLSSTYNMSLTHIAFASSQPIDGNFGTRGKVYYSHSHWVPVRYSQGPL